MLFIFSFQDPPPTPSVGKNILYIISWCTNVGAENTYDLQMKKDMNLLLNKYAQNEGFLAQC